MSPQVRVWFHFFGQVDVAERNTVIELTRYHDIDLYPLDLNSPTGPGIIFFMTFSSELCNFVRSSSHNRLNRVLVVALTDTALEVENVWHLLRAGAADVLALTDSSQPAKDIAARFERWVAVDKLASSDLVRNNLVGNGHAWTCVLRQVVEVAHFTDARILITGESGTGKELVARLLHTLDQRPNKRDFVVLDCTTIVPELSGSEFFGHERGAFTGAVASRDGAFALADGGTLFLDEVADLPLALQAELLRVVQEHTYKRVGSNTWDHTDFRLVCATNRDLLQEVEQGRFRCDLYYRIAGWTCRLPTLRERPEDVLPLIKYFIRQLRPDGELPSLDKGVREYLLKRDYPGNVRDLKQLVSRIMYRHVGPGPVTVGSVPEEERPAAELGPTDWSDESLERSLRRAMALGVGLKEIRRVAEDTAVRIAMGEENGNLQRAARRLGITDRALQMRRAAHRSAEQNHCIKEAGKVNRYLGGNRYGR